MRDNELARRGVPVVHLTGSELMNPARFRLNARNIAAQLGVRLRLEVPGWEERFRRLHAEVMNLEYVPPAVYDEEYRP